MRILYVESTIDHHSLPLAQRLHRLLPEGDFAYAGLRAISEERKALGWNSIECLPWMIPPETTGPTRTFCQWWSEANIVMCSAQLYQLMRERIREGKHMFYVSERWFKPPIGRLRLFHPRWLWRAMTYRRLADSRYFNYLAIGTYAARDMRWLCRMAGRLWSWAYFTEPSAALAPPSRDDRFRILWAGRMLRWKRVDTLIQAFSGLLKTRPDAILTLVGDGPEKDRLIHLAQQLLPEKACRYFPPTNPQAIRNLMADSHVYVLPSSGNEGWGAVINEAMTEGCAIVASEETGAAKTLIRDGVNGALYSAGDEARLTKILCRLGANEALRKRLANAGKRTIDGLWSPASAAERFLAIADALLSGHSIPRYTEGPMQSL